MYDIGPGVKSGLFVYLYRNKLIRAHMNQLNKRENLNPVVAKIDGLVMGESEKLLKALEDTVDLYAGLIEIQRDRMLQSTDACFPISLAKLGELQLQAMKQKNDAPVGLLIWLYLGNKRREEQYHGNVVFMNGNGCCNGLALDMFIMTKKLISHNNKS